MTADFKLEIIKDQSPLERLRDDLLSARKFSIDIETVEWWNRERERVALIQMAFRRPSGEIKVAVIDAFLHAGNKGANPRDKQATLNLETLRAPLEHKAVLKVIHNASFDSPRLEKHYGFQIAPVHDTMTTARRAGERKYSLKAQAQTHLDIRLDKSQQRSDWSRRPLDYRQLYYAASDSYATLLLYEHQTSRGLKDIHSGADVFKRTRPELFPALEHPQKEDAPADFIGEISDYFRQEQTGSIAGAVLGIVAELPTRFGPEALAANLTAADRTGVAGWIIDSRLGRDFDIDEETTHMLIAELIERKQIRLTPSRRLEVTEQGARYWQSIK